MRDKKPMKYIIEHLEPRLYRWCMVEYSHISEIVGKNKLIFTNIRANDKNKLKKYGKTTSKSVNESAIKKAIILDPSAKKSLVKDDFRKYDYLIFGGILGDYPRKKRTKLITLNGIKRNLGKKQMSTDTAVYAAKQIENGKKIKDLKFIDNLEIKIKKGESINLPFRYVIEENNPVLAKGFIKFIKTKSGF